MQVLGDESLLYRRTEPASSVFIEVYEKCDDAEDRQSCAHHVQIVYMKDSETQKYHKVMSLQDFISHFSTKYQELHQIFHNLADAEANPTTSQICETEYIKFLSTAENTGSQFILTTGNNFIKNLSKEHNILNLYKDFAKKYKELTTEKQEEL